MKNQKSLFLLITVFLTIVFLLPISSIAKQPYKLGAVFSVTGPASILGDPQKKTVLMLEKEVNAAGGINGRPIEVVIYDDETQDSKTVLAVNRLIKKDEVCCIIGPSLTGTTLAVIPIVEKHGIPLFTSGSSEKIVEPIKKWVFKATPGEQKAFMKIINGLLVPKKIKKVAMLHVSNAYGQSGAEKLRTNAPKFGIQVVIEETFGQKDNDMSAQLVRIRNSDAQALIVWGTNPGPAIISKNAYELGLKIPIIQSWGSVSQRFLDLAGKYAEGQYMVATRIAIAPYLPDDDPGKAVTLKYMKDFESAYGEPANTFGGNAWVGFKMFAKALEAVGDDPAKIRDYLETVKDFEGPPGKYSLSPTDHMGVGWEGLSLIKIKGGKFLPYEGD